MKLNWNTFVLAMLVSSAAMFFFAGIVSAATTENVFWLLLWLPATVLASLAVAAEMSGGEVNEG